jgi:hypothetical protein
MSYCNDDGCDAPEHECSFRDTLILENRHMRQRLRIISKLKLEDKDMLEDAVLLARDALKST